jgi:hypothetical protein
MSFTSFTPADWIVVSLLSVVFLIVVGVIASKLKKPRQKGFSPKISKIQDWEPVGNPFVSGGKVYIVEWSKKKQLYRYARVPSNTKLNELMEGE